MKSDHDLERQLHQLADVVRHGSSIVDDVMNRVEKTSIAPASPAWPWRRIMKSRTLKWWLPAAAAAAVVVAVGLWPESGPNGGGGSGQVYGMSDVPALLKNARTLHLKGRAATGDSRGPDGQPQVHECEIWFDLQRGRFKLVAPAAACGPQYAGLGLDVKVCDGQYYMDTVLATRPNKPPSKTIRFQKLTPYMAMFKAREADMVTQLLDNVDRFDGFSKVGQETRGGESYDVWKGELSLGGIKPTLEVQLAPASGRIGRVRMEVKAADQIVQWVEYDVEKDIELPDGLFSTEPPPGAALENTKATAPLLSLDQGGEPIEGYTLVEHISFTLADGSVLSAWSSLDRDRPDQSALFKGLTPGGALPKLPGVIKALKTVPPQPGLVYAGRHLAVTRRNGRSYEWALYVPNMQPPPRSSLAAYQMDIQYNSDKRKFSQWPGGTSRGLPVETAADFDRWVRGAMAELNENGVAPESLTYDYVLQVSRRIRESLKNQPDAAAPPASRPAEVGE